jgi:plasmid stabilization system protein ParE
VAEVSLHAAAEAEYEAALDWYLARSPRAAAGFEAAVERALDFIGTFPEACPRCDDQHRYCPLRRYSYGLVYRVDGDRVLVVAVPHDRQLPGFWVGRT